MSGWSFLSKAEGFLDRVLDESPREKTLQKSAGTAPLTNEGEHIEVPDRVTTPSTRWQDRLTKAASQFTSSDSLVSLAPKRSLESADLSRNSVDLQQETTALHTNHIEATVAHQSATQPEPLTELQQSRIFPANMPDRSISDSESIESAVHKRSVEASIKSHGNAGTSPQVRSSRASLDTQEPPQKDDMDVSSTPDGLMSENSSESVRKLQADLQACELRRVEELQQSSERISTLEARLAFLSKERVSETQEVATSKQATQQQKVLAEKDQRIALLLEEGDNMSKKELQHMTNIKRLRARVSELEGLITSSLKAIEKADNDGSKLRRESKTLQETVKQNEARIRELTKFESEVGDLRREKQVLSKINNDLKRQLADADETISQNVTIWTQLQSEKSKSEALQKRIGELLLEAKSTADENAADMADYQGKLERLTERSKSVETEKNQEIARLEAEIESLRGALEESSTNASENSQTKLLRQIESLQTQQSLARQNWARIEESLVLRSTHAEKERDELRLQEDELRTRLRTANIQRKQIEEERHAAFSKLRTLENDMKDMREEHELLSKKLRTLQDNIAVERQDWEAEKQTLIGSVEAQVQERLEEERLNEVPGSVQSPYMDTIPRSGFAFQRHITDSPNAERTPNKRPGMNSRTSTQASRMPGRRSASQSQLHHLEEMRSPTMVKPEEDPFSPSESLSQLKAPTERSLSTTSAGASVGMMERVSANVRKLEMEMILLREDVSRLTRQRNEARQECVALETRLSEHEALAQSLRESESKYNQLQAKFETTLELLGEQTEENDQLKEDIIDMKKAFATSLQDFRGQ